MTNKRSPISNKRRRVALLSELLSILVCLWDEKYDIFLSKSFAMRTIDARQGQCPAFLICICLFLIYYHQQRDGQIDVGSIVQQITRRPHHFGVVWKFDFCDKFYWTAFLIKFDKQTFHSYLCCFHIRKNCGLYWNIVVILIDARHSSLLVLVKLI